MSATIGELVEEFVPFTEDCDKVVNVEIVPKKMIDNIMQRIREEIETEYILNRGRISKEVIASMTSLECFIRQQVDKFEGVRR